MSREHIAATLKRLREEAGLTVYQVGEMVGKSGKTVSAWENNRGQPDAEMLMLLCDIYNVDDILSEFKEHKQIDKDIRLTDFERDLILSYRQHPEMQSAINKMLDIDVKENAVDVFSDIAKEINQSMGKNVDIK